MEESTLAAHKRFLKYCLNVLPAKYQAQEVNRLTLTYFVINALDVLGELDAAIGGADNKRKMIDFIYSLQVVPDTAEPERLSHNFGFRGSPFFGQPFNPQCTPLRLFDHDQGHLAMDYCALSLLATLGDDFGRVNKPALLRGMRQLQQPDGSFSPVAGGSENDMRFVYCAAVCCALLDDWSGMDVERTVAFIARSQRYDGGIGQGGARESHGGSTYCAVASLSLMGRLDVLDKPLLVDWLARRQVTGFQGRVNKPPDSCYGFWIGASLRLLGAFDAVINKQNLASFEQCCANPMGGFAKHADANPDVLHTYYSLCCLSFCAAGGPKEGLLRHVNPQYGLTERAVAAIKAAQAGTQ